MDRYKTVLFALNGLFAGLGALTLPGLFERLSRKIVIGKQLMPGDSDNPSAPA